MELAQLAVGSTARIAALDVGAGSDLSLRLRELGLRPGAVVQVVNRAAFGGRVLAMCAPDGARGAGGTARLGIDGRTARAIQVVPARRGAGARA